MAIKLTYVCVVIATKLVHWLQIRPNGAQIEGTRYHSSKLYPGPHAVCGNATTDRHTDGRAWPTFISPRRLCLHAKCNNKSSAVAEMGDRLATIDIGRKVGGCCAPFRGGGTEAPHFSAHVYYLCLCWFLDRQFPHWDAGWWKPNQLVRVETNNFIRLCIIPITEFSVNLLPITALYHYKILLSISHLLEPPEQFVSELSICTTIIHDFCVLFLTLMIHYSQHFLPFSAT